MEFSLGDNSGPAGGDVAQVNHPESPAKKKKKRTNTRKKNQAESSPAAPPNVTATEMMAPPTPREENIIAKNPFEIDYDPQPLTQPTQAPLEALENMTAMTGISAMTNALPPTSNMQGNPPGGTFQATQAGGLPPYNPNTSTGQVPPFSGGGNQPFSAPPQGSLPPPPMYPCGICAQDVKENDEAIFCESGCNYWFHRRCAGMTKAAYNLLTSEPSAEWACDYCIATKQIPLMKYKPIQTNTGPIGMYHHPSDSVVTSLHGSV